MKDHHKISRRRFLKDGSCLAMGTTTLFSTLVDLCKANTHDSYNMLVPRGASEYQQYADTRTVLAIPQTDLLPINPITPHGKTFGLHPNMSAIQQLFEDGNLAFIANVGTLVEPLLNEDDYRNKLRPQKLFSHPSQKEQWQTSIPINSTGIGWGGRTAELLSSMNDNPAISMNISLDGKNIFQSSNTLLEYSITRSGNGAKLVDPMFGGYSNRGILNMVRNQTSDDILGQSYQNILKETLSGQTKDALQAGEFFESTLAGVPPFQTPFSSTDISSDFSMVARTIAARDALGMSRQIFMVRLGGFDNHNNFGRTLTSNGNGSDHAWGGNAMVMGGAVNGKEVYGSYPDISSDIPLSVSRRGKLIPTTSCDEYFAELISWFGVSDGDIPYVLPNIGNFYSVGSTTPPLGFLL